MDKESSIAVGESGDFVADNIMSVGRETTLVPGMSNDLNELNANSSEVDRNAITDNIQEPYEAMEFKTAEDAMHFSNLYAYRMGFSVRKCSHYMSAKKGIITSQLFVCSSEGQYQSKRKRSKRDSSEHEVSTPQKQAQTMRTGCKASLRVKMEDENRWVISKFSKEHNHDLEASPSKARYFRSHRNITEEQKAMIHVLNEQNISSGQIMSVVASQHGGIKNVNFTRKDLSNQLVETRKNLIGVDVASAIKYFKDLQAENPSFYYDILVEDDNTARNLFWVDGRSRIAYHNFGDVVTFDTTYMTNKYGMPFAPFIGVNHHRQSILFGCALIRNESAASFIWVFETWLQAMFGKHTKAILTDQDLAMKKAIEQVFPDTVHRCCQWHIMRKARDHLGMVYGSKEGFQGEFTSCINDSLTMEEFHQRWKLTIKNYDLEDNSHLTFLYKIREQWVPAVFKDTFFAEMSTTQCSESMNALFKGIVDCHTSIYRFVFYYEKAVESQYDKEDEEDFRTNHVIPSLWSAYPIEKHAREVYTRTIFRLFREQLKLTSSYDLEKSENAGIYILIKLNDPGKPHAPRASYTVSANASLATASCNCKMFEFSGMLCSHVLKVLIQLKIHYIPSQYILKRWTKNANDSCSYVNVEKSLKIDHSSSKATRFNALCKKILRIASEASTCVETYELTCRKMEILLEEIILAKKSIVEEKAVEEVQVPQLELSTRNKVIDENLVKDPPQSQCKGRTKIQRYKCPFEISQKV